MLRFSRHLIPFLSGENPIGSPVRKIWGTSITGKDGFVVLVVTAVMLFASIIIAMMTPMSPTKLAGTLPRSPGV